MLQSTPASALVNSLNVLDQAKTSLADIHQRLEAIVLSDETIAAYEKHDARHPYGRNVLFASNELEVMVATWTPHFQCAPHDHGGSVGAVKVLKGTSLHRSWRVQDGALTLVKEELIHAGQVILADASLIHSMGDAGGTDTLVTLHVYAGPVTHMVVYDRARAQTHVVHGGCGAWIPLDQPALIRATHAGFLPVNAVCQ